MATWKKALLVGLAVLVGVVPVLAKVDGGWVVQLQSDQIVLPEGVELEASELAQTEGDSILVAVIEFAAAGAAAVGAYLAAAENPSTWQAVKIFVVSGLGAVIVDVAHSAFGGRPVPMGGMMVATTTAVLDVVPEAEEELGNHPAFGKEKCVFIDYGGSRPWP